MASDLGDQEVTRVSLSQVWSVVVLLCVIALVYLVTGRHTESFNNKPHNLATITLQGIIDREEAKLASETLSCPGF